MYKFSFIFLSLLFAACTSPKQTEDSNDNLFTKGKPAISNEKLDGLKDRIEANKEEYDIASSLSFQHNDGSTEDVLAYLDKDKQILKIEEKYTNGTNGDVGTRTFYLDNGKKFMSIELFSDNENGKGAYRERVSYYDDKGNVLSTKDRLSQFEEDVEKEEFVNAPKYNCSMETAENVLNNKGVFATTFQGFVNNGHMTYLLVGGPGETGYASALAVQYQDDQIKKLMANEKSFVNKPLTVEFEKMVDEKDLEFQVLMGMRLE